MRTVLLVFTRGLEVTHEAAVAEPLIPNSGQNCNQEQHNKPGSKQGVKRDCLKICLLKMQIFISFLQLFRWMCVNEMTGHKWFN